MSVQLPGPLVWELLKQAEEKHTTVAQMLWDATRPRMRLVPSVTAETHARIVDLVKAGWDDGSISVEVQRTRGYVADVRRRAVLKPNKRGKRVL